MFSEIDYSVPLIDILKLAFWMVGFFSVIKFGEWGIQNLWKP